MAENQIIVYQPNETVRLDVWLANETVWLNQSRIGELFGVDRTVVNRHIHNIYKTGELDEPSTCAKIAQVQKEGGRAITRQLPFYNLDMIIAVGYRVNSFAATQFRKWATTILREYLLRGYAVNQRLCDGYMGFNMSCLVRPPARSGAEGWAAVHERRGRKFFQPAFPLPVPRFPLPDRIGDRPHDSQ